MLGKERAWGSLLRIECELGQGPRLYPRGWMWANWYLHYPFEIVPVWRNTCHDLSERSDSDHYKVYRNVMYQCTKIIYLQCYVKVVKNNVYGMLSNLECYLSVQISVLCMHMSQDDKYCIKMPYVCIKLPSNYHLFMHMFVFFYFSWSNNTQQPSNLIHSIKLPDI